MKLFLISISILLTGLAVNASAGGNTCSGQSILPGGCTDMPKNTAAEGKFVVLNIPKIHCESCSKNIDKVISKLKLPAGVTHETSVENKSVTLRFAKSMDSEKAKAASHKIRAALNKRGYKITN